MRVKWVNMLRIIFVFISCFMLTNQVDAKEQVSALRIATPTLGIEVPLPYKGGSSSADWLRLIFDPLVGTTPDGKISTESGIAQKWEMSRDGMTWTFHLRKGMKFHNGTEVTANDVKFSFEQVVRPDSGVTQKPLFEEVIKSMEVKDPYTLVVRCKKPYPFLDNLFSDLAGPAGAVFPKDYFERVGADGFAKRPIGSGPYKWDSQLSGSFIKLESIGEHWRCGVPRYKYVTFLNVPEESSRIAMLKTGEAEIANISRDKVKEVRDAGMNIVTREDVAVALIHLTMQWATPAFSDVRFRKALNLAIDRNAIIQHLFAGRGTPSSGYLGKSILTCGGDPTLKAYPYNPAEARRLIKEGGYSGYAFKVASYPRPGLSEYPRLVEAVAGYWEEIGLKPEIVQTEWVAFRQKWYAGKSENWVGGFDSASAPGCPIVLDKLWRKFHSSVEASITHIPELDAMLEKASTSLNQSEVRGIIKKFSQFEYNNYLTMPVCSLNDELATSKKVPKWDAGQRLWTRNYIGLIQQDNVSPKKGTK